MREILRTSSVSLAESLRLALEAEDIPVIIANEHVGGLPPQSISVAVVEDSDYDRSVAILATLETAGASRRPPWAHRIVRVLVVLALLAFVVFCGVYWP
jgi:hypothetical protein